MECEKLSSIKHPKEDKYDVFFTYSVPLIDGKYLKNGKIRLVGEKRNDNDGTRNFKCFSLNVSEKYKYGNHNDYEVTYGDIKNPTVMKIQSPDFMHTMVYGEPVGYEFDFDDDNFIVKS